MSVLNFYSLISLKMLIVEIFDDYDNENDTGMHMLTCGQPSPVRKTCLSKYQLLTYKN